MKSGGSSVNYFLKNKLTNLANIMQFIHMLMPCLEDCEGGWAPCPLLPPMGYVIASAHSQFAVNFCRKSKQRLLGPYLS